jgi:hypothetical protein
VVHDVAITSQIPLPTVRRAGMIAGAIIGVYATLVLTRWPNEETVRTLTDFAFPAASLIYVPLAALAAHSARGRLRAAWLMLTASFAAWALAEILWTYYAHVVGEVPYPSWADVFYMLYVPLMGAALLLFPGTRSWRDQRRLIVDGLIVTGSFFLISWLTVMRSVWQERGASQLEFALSLAYPAGDVLIMTLGFLVLLRAPSGLRTSLSLLVAALACSAVGNGVWSYLGDTDAYRVGGLADVFYFANILLVILSLIAAQRAQAGPEMMEASPGRVSLWLPLLPLAIAAVFVVIAPRAAVKEAPVIIAGALLVIATLVRQLMQGDDLIGREKGIRLLADRLNGELDSAADYVASILPGDLAGPLAVRSRYLPSRAVGGDSFGYTWIDDDHLIVYLIDVSGHGVRPALLSVSVHNLLRSNSMTRDTLLAPDHVLAELNTRFDMKSHGGHYFTMWYGVYQRSTGRLRYANAGHPPPLLLTERGGVVTSFPHSDGMPLGMLAAREYTVEECVVVAGSEILIYSDGVLGNPPRVSDFVALCTELTAKTGSWLDSLVAVLPVGADGTYEDDCSLVWLSFPEDNPSTRSGFDQGAVSTTMAATV